MRLFSKAFILHEIFRKVAAAFVALVLKPLKKQVNILVLWQVFFLLCLALVFFVAKGKAAFIATACGGLVSIIPGYLYAARLFANVAPRSVGRILLVFYLGEGIKFIVSLVLFCLLFKFFAFSLWPYVSGYLVANLTFCGVAMYLMSKTMVSTR